MRSLLKTIAVLGIGALSAPIFGQQPGRPGTVNYLEGTAYLDGRQLNPQDLGNIQMNAGDTLRTATGKAEILLTPGVFLRLDDGSSVKMISPDLTPTKVELQNGRAAVEVDQLFKQNDLEITDAGVTTHLAKEGYYEFDANHPTAMVFQGEAVVDEEDRRPEDIKQHRKLALIAGATVKPAKFDPHDAQDSLYNWSSLRSEYLAEANNQIAGQYAWAAGFVPGWYWDPYMWDYTFIGMGPYWSPFGFGFYPPWGWYGGVWRGGYYGGRYYGRDGYAGGYGGRAYAGGGFAGGGFHGGGGGGRR
jgi:hypothetical protein